MQEEKRNRGRLDLIIGPMFAGKTTELHNRLLRFVSKGNKRGLFINHLADTRDLLLSTHNPSFKLNTKVDVDYIKIDDIYDFSSAPRNLCDYDCICVDEAQFFNESIVDFCKFMVEHLHLYVIVAGLDSTYDRKKFGYILDIIPICDNISKLKSICADCEEDAIFSHKYASDCKKNESVEIGASEIYKPLCRQCYLREN